MRAQKWFTGEAWSSFCAGERGSPGGPVGIATLMLIVAEDMQRQGVIDEPLRLTHQGAAAVEDRTEMGRGRGRTTAGSRGRGRGRSSFTQRAASSLANEIQEDQEHDIVLASASELQFIPSRMEQQADAADLAIIRELFGSRAQTILNTLLAFDAYFTWYYPLKQSISFMCPMAEREARALENCRAAVDMHEAFERVSMRNHGSYLPHAAIFKVTRDIMRVGDVYAVNLSPLELNNADTKRTADRAASRRLCMSSEGETRRPMRGNHEGPEVMVKTRGYSTSMAISTLKNMLAQRYLRRGDGIIATPSSRRKERLFGQAGSGRSTTYSGNVKLEKLRGSGYEPMHDTCIKAFVRLLSVSVEADS